MEVKAFQWNVRPRWGRIFWKSVRCCVQLVFIMFVFSRIDGLSWVFHGYHALFLCFLGVFTSLVARSVVQDSYKHRRILGRCYNKCLWGKARMGSAYHFNLLMYFLALRIGTRRLPVISYESYLFGFTHYIPEDESRGNCILVCQACVPLLSLLLPAAAAWLGFLFCSTAESSWV